MQIVNSHGRPVAGYVEFVFSRFGQIVGVEPVLIGRNGKLSLPTLAGTGPITARRGTERALHAERVLTEMRQNLGMDPLRQGVGLPSWRPP